MKELTKIELQFSDGRKVSIPESELSNVLKRKLRKETQKFVNPRQLILEPMSNERYVDV